MIRMTRIARLKADANRWGWKRSIFSHLTGYAARHFGINVHVVRTCALAEDSQYPSTLPGISFRQIPAEELLAASSDPSLDLTRDFVSDVICRHGKFEAPMYASGGFCRNSQPCKSRCG
jgi:hypothetical protein